MPLPAALGSLAPYAVEYAPYVIMAASALYGMAGELGEKYGPRMKEIWAAYREEGFEAISKYRSELFKIAGYAAATGIRDAVEIYEQLTSSLSGGQGRPRTTSARQVTTTAVLLFLSLASLTYFTLVPQKTTVHVIVPMTTNVPGMVLSFILLCFGAWLVLKK